MDSAGPFLRRGPARGSALAALKNGPNRRDSPISLEPRQDAMDSYSPMFPVKLRLDLIDPEIFLSSL